MRIKKWLMKQQWRIVQIRGIWGLFYSIALLAISYYVYIPFFSDLGVLGPAAFMMAAFVGFLILGYVYDRVLVMWAPSGEVTQERNPYQYVPSPKEHIFWFPLFSTLLESAEKLGGHFGVDTTIIEETKQYYSELQKLVPENKNHIERAISLRKEYVSEHSFADILKERE